MTESHDGKAAVGLHRKARTGNRSLNAHSGVPFHLLQEARMFGRNCLFFHRLSAVSFALLLIAMPAMAQETKSVTLELDHVSVCGSSLDTLRQYFTDVGLTPDFGGPHGNGITQMAMIGFDDGTY